jgi:hypothetical protein
MECRIRIAIKTLPIHNTDYGTVISPWYLKEIESGLGCGEFGLNHPVLTARRDLSTKNTKLITNKKIIFLKIIKCFGSGFT